MNESLPFETVFPVFSYWYPSYNYAGSKKKKKQPLGHPKNSEDSRHYGCPFWTVPNTFHELIQFLDFTETQPHLLSVVITCRSLMSFFWLPHPGQPSRSPQAQSAENDTLTSWPARSCQNESPTALLYCYAIAIPNHDMVPRSHFMKTFAACDNKAVIVVQWFCALN